MRSATSGLTALLLFLELKPMKTYYSYKRLVKEDPTNRLLIKLSFFTITAITGHRTESYLGTFFTSFLMVIDFFFYFLSISL